MYKSGSATTIHIEKHMSGPTTTVLQSEIQNFCCIYCYYVLVELYTSSSAKIYIYHNQATILDSDSDLDPFWGRVVGAFS